MYFKLGRVCRRSTESVIFCWAFFCSLHTNSGTSGDTHHHHSQSRLSSCHLCQCCSSPQILGTHLPLSHHLRQKSCSHYYQSPCKLRCGLTSILCVICLSFIVTVLFINFHLFHLFLLFLPSCCLSLFLLLLLLFLCSFCFLNSSKHLIFSEGLTKKGGLNSLGIFGCLLLPF